MSKQGASTGLSVPSILPKLLGAGSTHTLITVPLSLALHHKSIPVSHTLGPAICEEPLPLTMGSFEGHRDRAMTAVKCGLSSTNKQEECGGESKGEQDLTLKVPHGLWCDAAAWLWGWRGAVCAHGYHSEVLLVLCRQLLAGVRGAV